MSIHEDFAPVSSPAYVEAAANQPLGYAHGVLKRLLDLAIAIPLLILLAPVMGAIALIVRTGSEGPALFRQTRQGLYGAHFQILKFRTMTVLENGPAIVQATRNDGRITRAGQWLRRTSLDELPQLINVINGDMSLIGPRPHALAHDHYYGRQIAHYDLRQDVKPGISGWAQVNGLRGETLTVDRMRDRVDHDVWYVRNASFALDMKILFRTAAVVLRQRNAY